MLVVDLSNVNGHVDWRRISRAGIKAAFVKASEGVSFDDPMFRAHRESARRAGIHVGAYHFARPDHNRAVDEARHFARIVGKLRVGELKPVLDFETPAHQLTPSRMEQWARDFNHEVKRLLGVVPLFYSYPAFISGMGRMSKPIGSGLWLASYGRNDGREHPFYTPRPWRFSSAHQFTSNARVAGVPGRVDLSRARSLTAILAHPVRSQPHRLVMGGRRMFE